jgi:hypothetical protein
VVQDEGFSVGDPGATPPAALQTNNNTRMPFSITKVLENPNPTLELVAGNEYEVGICGCVDDDGTAGNFDWQPGFGHLRVQVVQPAN